VKRAALLLALLVCACAATPTPTRDELAETLRASGETIATSEYLTHIACKQADDVHAELACRWRQRGGRHWQDRQAYLSLASGDWQLVGKPSQRP